MRRASCFVLLALALVLSGFAGIAPAQAQGTVYTDTMDSAESGLLSVETFDPSISFVYQSGQFVVTVQQPSYQGDIISTLSVPELASSRLTVDATIAGDPANKYVIAGCRHTDAGEGYFFGYLPATGDLIIWRRDVTGDTNIAQSVDTSLIVPAGTTYQIGIDCWTNVITGIVNGQPVASAFDATYPTGRPTIGIGANGQQTDGLTVAFDNLTVTDNGNLELGAVAPTGPTLPPVQGSSVVDVVFDRTRQTAVGHPALVAGLSGSFTQEADVYAYAGADVSLGDLYTIVTFVNPADVSAPFDVGIGFRDDRDSEGGLRMVIASDGTWYLQQPGQDAIATGTATGFDATAGASNVIELLVQGATGIAAVNGVVLPQLDLSSVNVRGDVYIGTGFFQGDSVPGRVIPYGEWWIYPTDILDVPSG